MRIHVLTTGMARAKHAFVYARSGPRRQPALFMPGEFADPLPIHCFVIEHEGEHILVDTGATTKTRDIPFVRFAVTDDDELPRVLAAAGLSVEHIDRVVLTHLHSDHMDGAHYMQLPIEVHDLEIAYAHSLRGRVMAKLLHQPLPDALLQPVALDDGPFGAFAATRRITADGRVRLVATPGHTPGHVSVLCEDDEGRHVLLAGDATDTLEQLRARRHDAVGPSPKQTVETIDRILAHGREHPTIYVPSHDVDSMARLESGAVL